MKAPIPLITLSALFKRDFLALWRVFPSRAFDTALFFVTNAIVWTYLMPEQWLSPSYGPFIVIGAIGSLGLIEVTAKISVLIADIDGERKISQLLMLPISSSMLFCYIAFFWSFTSFMLTILLFPLAKLLLFKQLDFSAFSYGRLIVIFISVNLFYGFFALWITSLLKGLNGLNGLWARVISPMWFFGAYFYSWKTTYALSPWIGYISLFNPMVYAMEGMRSTTLNPNDYLPFWVCVVALWIVIFCCAAHGIARLRRRLDCL